MNFIIGKKIFEKFNDLNIGVVIARNIDNTGFSEEIQEMIRKKENEIRSTYSAETIFQDPRIDVWRKAYAAFGAKPKENRSSVENLYKLVLQGVNLRHINNMVDTYNFISLKHMVPVGGEDLDKIVGDINLTFASTNEPPVILLGDKEPRPPHEGEVIYKDELSAICRRWNWREADRTKFTESTKNCVLVIEGLSLVTRQEVEDATAELKEMVKKFCGGDIEYKILDKNQSEIEL